MQLYFLTIRTLTSRRGMTSSREIEEGRICGTDAEGGAYGDGRAGTCEDISTMSLYHVCPFSSLLGRT